MTKKQRHIIFSWLLILALVIPPLWQLEHVFDNSHGIVYKSDHQEIKKNPKDFCGPLHKQLQFHSVLNLYFFDTPNFPAIILINSDFPEIPHIKFIPAFSLRAPPALA